MRRLLLVLCVVAAVGLPAVALASPDETVSFNEPQPGGTITAASQSINDSKKVVVDVKGDLNKTTVVVDGGARKAAADAVAACWLAGPQAIPVNNARVRQVLRDPELQEILDAASPEQAVYICMQVVAVIAEQLVDDSLNRAVASAGRCTATPLNFRLGSTVTLAKPKAGPKTRYSCRKTAGGISLTARDAKGRPLRKALGPKLDVGLYKTTDGPPSDGKMSLRYRLR